MAEIDWARFQSFYGMTDADLEKVKRSPKMVKIIRAGPRIVRTRLACEVVSAQYCSLGLKPGQRYFISCHGHIMADQCTAQLCAYLIAPLVRMIRVIHDRICEGLGPNGVVWDPVRCLDPGLDCGGLGQVGMRVWVEEISMPQKSWLDFQVPYARAWQLKVARSAGKELGIV